MSRDERCCCRAVLGLCGLVLCGGFWLQVNSEARADGYAKWKSVKPIGNLAKAIVDLSRRDIFPKVPSANQFGSECDSAVTDSRSRQD